MEILQTCAGDSVNHFPTARLNPKRKEPRRVGNGRVKLADKTELRRQAFKRSGGKCEMVNLKPFPGRYVKTPVLVRCGAPITWKSMHLSHDRHGPNKSDALATVKASCEKCHRDKHNAGGKPCPRKPGRVMTPTEAREYLAGEKCYCEKPKKKDTTYCAECREKLSPQTARDIDTLVHDEFLKAMGNAEKEIMSYRPAEAGEVA